MSDQDADKLDLLEKKIDRLEIKVKTSLEEKLREVSEDCEDLYDQITEIRNTIQEMYGEILESGRFQSGQLIRMSERLENMAKDIYKNSTYETPSIQVHVSPEINTSNNNNNNINNNDDDDQKHKKKKEDDSSAGGIFNINKISLKEMIFYISSAIIGVLVIIGGVVFTIYKILPELLNIIK